MGVVIGTAVRRVLYDAISIFALRLLDRTGDLFTLVPPVLIAFANRVCLLPRQCVRRTKQAFHVWSHGRGVIVFPRIQKRYAPPSTACGMTRSGRRPR